MRDLVDMKCVPCRGGVPKLTEIETRELHTLVSNWDIVDRDGILRLEREFPFQDFTGAFDFTNKVGKLALNVDHDPAIVTGYNQTTVTWWTHSARGLHRNDFIMAARTDQLYNQG